MTGRLDFPYCDLSTASVLLDTQPLSGLSFLMLTLHFVNRSLVTSEHLKHPVPGTGSIRVESLTRVSAEATQAHCGCLLVLQMDNLRLREG